MNARMRTAVVVAALFCLVLTGCARFSASKKMDMGPFGENTTAMVNDIKQGFVFKKPILIKPYMYGAALEKTRKDRDDVRKVLGAVVLYSTQVVNLSRAKFTDQEKAKALGEYIQKLAGRLVEHRDPDIQYSQEKFDATIKTIVSEQTFLDALASAQPLVDAMEKYVSDTLEIMSEAINQFGDEVAVRIDKNSAEPLDSFSSLKAIQVRSIKSYSLLTSYRDGNADALDALVLNDPALRTYVKKGTALSPRELDTMEKELMLRLQNVQTMLDQLKPRIDVYYAEVQEMDDVLRTVQDAIRKMRVAVILWSRSHANLGAGIPVPPEIDLASMITGGAVGAAKKVVPGL